MHLFFVVPKLGPPFTTPWGQHLDLHFREHTWLEQNTESVDRQLEFRTEPHENTAGWFDVALPLEDRLHDATFAVAETELLGKPVVVHIALALLQHEEQPVVKS